MSKRFLSFVLLCILGTAPLHAAEGFSDKARVDEALSAERHHDKHAINLWNQIANSEIGSGRTFQGIQHERRAMQLYDKECVGERSGPLGYLGSWIIRGLTQQGHSEDAEKLLIESVARAESVTGSNSIVTEAQIADLFAFYVNQKNYRAALKTLGRILRFDLSNGDTPSQSLMRSAPNVLHRLQPNNSVEILHLILGSLQEAEESNISFAITAIEKILRAQESSLADDDERLVETLGSLGDAYFQDKKYNAADQYYRRAYEITKRYHHESAFAVHQCGKNFLPNLRKLGRSEEADRLAKLKLEATPNFNLPPAQPN